VTFKAIVFDMNGVFAVAPEKKIIDSACAQLKMDKWIAYTNYYLNLWDYERGFISPQDFWKKVFSKISKEQYRVLVELQYEARYKKNDLLYSIAKDLSKKYDIYILSNSNFLQGKEYRKQKLYAPFKEIFLSHETNEIKPFPQAYQKFLEKTKLKAGECVFVDDSIFNVLTSMALGFKGLVFQDSHDLEEKLKKLKLI